jgi:hypothetical protein
MLMSRVMDEKIRALWLPEIHRGARKNTNHGIKVMYEGSHFHLR